MTDAVAELTPHVGVRAACQALGVAQAGYYRRHRRSPAPERPAPFPHHDRHQTRTLHHGGPATDLQGAAQRPFADMAPAEVWAILLDEGLHLGSIATFYRLLRVARKCANAARSPTRRRRTGAGGDHTESGVWSWDMAKLRGPEMCIYYHLYVILDIFSRYVVGWMIAGCELRGKHPSLADGVQVPRYASDAAGCSR